MLIMIAGDFCGGAVQRWRRERSNLRSNHPGGSGGVCKDLGGDGGATVVVIPPAPVAGHPTVCGWGVKTDSLVIHSSRTGAVS